MQYLLESDKLTQNDKEVFSLLLKKDMDDETLCCSLREMSEFLQKHYGRKTIVLIDEYDVPLAKANEHNYYEPMVFLVRNIFEQVLKTNDSLYFAVLIGCLRVAKESIFTGLNNLNVLSVRDVEFDEYFGFTDQEVKALLNYYGFSDTYSLVKDWYDGYQFGNTNVYCPWDVICFCKKRRVNRAQQPENYWSNTSGNDVIRHFLRKAKPVTKREIEKLIAGECVLKEIHQELTYKNLYRSVEHIWSVLFTTGYLTQRGESADGKSLWLVIPNHDYSDILIEIEDMQIGIVIELKYPLNGNLELGCEEAMNQIELKRYAARLSDDGMKTILKYGIACYKKRCRVVLEKEEL